MPSSGSPHGFLGLKERMPSSPVMVASFRGYRCLAIRWAFSLKTRDSTGTNSSFHCLFVQSLPVQLVTILEIQLVTEVEKKREQTETLKVFLSQEREQHLKGFLSCRLRPSFEGHKARSYFPTNKKMRGQREDKQEKKTKLNSAQLNYRSSYICKRATKKMNKILYNSKFYRSVFQILNKETKNNNE